MSLIDLCATQFLNLDIPIANNGALEDLTYEGFQAMLSSTSENCVFNLEHINPADLVAHPQGELEIAMAPQPDAESLELGDLFNDFDFGAEFATTTQEVESGAVNPLDTIVQSGNLYNDFASLFQTPHNPELQAYTGLQNAPAQQVRPPPPPPTQPTKMQVFTQMTNSRYIPLAPLIHQRAEC